MKSRDKKKPKELSMIHKQYSVLSNKKSETQTKELEWIKDIVERIIIDAVQNVSVRRNGVDTWDNQAYDESVTFWTRKIKEEIKKL